MQADAQPLTAEQVGAHTHHAVPVPRNRIQTPTWRDSGSACSSGFIHHHGSRYWRLRSIQFACCVQG
jgi:hypothetical protein